MKKSIDETEIPIMNDSFKEIWREQCLKNFIQNQLHLNPKKMQITPIQKPADLPGKWGPNMHPMFLIKDSSDKPLAILKTYPESKSGPEQFTPLAFSTQLFQSLNLKHSTCVNILGYGRGTSNNHTIDIVAMSIAKGFGLDQLIQERHPSLHAAIEAYARAIGELHNLRISPTGNVPKKILRTEQIYLQQYALLIPNHEKILTLMMQLLASPEVHSGPFGITHGDADPTNFFYDPDSDQLTMVDLEHLKNSMDDFGHPTDLIGAEYARILCGLDKVARLRDYSEKETQDLLNHFKKAYHAHIPHIPKDQVTFFSALFWIRKILWVTRLEQKLDPEKNRDPKYFQLPREYRTLATTHLQNIIEQENS